MPQKLLRIPLTGSHNARVSIASNLASSSAIAGIGVAGIMVAGRTLQGTSKDSRFVNCYSHKEVDPITGEARIYCVKRSGFAALNTPQSGSVGNQIIVWSGQGSGTKVITAFGATNSSIYDGTTRLATNNGDTTIITGLAASISETSVSGTATLYITSSDSTAWYYQNGGTVTKISDSDFPGNNSLTLAGGGAHMDGFTFQMDTNGDIWNSDLNSITAWTASSKISAGTYPDKGIGCVRWKNMIIGFGTGSMEFFRNNGNPTFSPLTRVTEMAQKIGAVSATAIAEISDNIYFVGSTPQGGLSVFQWNGQLNRISNPEVDAVLQLMGAGNVGVTTMRDAGLSFVLVYGGGMTYAYVIEDKFWFQMNGPAILWTKCAGVSVGTSQVTYSVSNLTTSGKVYTINPASRTFQDDGVGFTATAQLATVDPGNGGFTRYDEAQIKADVESSTSNLMLSWSDDDYATFSTARTLDLSGSIPKTTGLGGTKNPRAFQMTHASNTPFRIQELRLRVQA